MSALALATLALAYALHRRRRPRRGAYRLIIALRPLAGATTPEEV